MVDILKPMAQTQMNEVTGNGRFILKELASNSRNYDNELARNGTYTKAMDDLASN